MAREAVLGKMTTVPLRFQVLFAWYNSDIYIHIYIYTFVSCKGLINRPSKGRQRGWGLPAGAQQSRENPSFLFFFFVCFYFSWDGIIKANCYKT